jgi:hypothetical protein
LEGGLGKGAEDNGCPGGKRMVRVIAVFASGHVIGTEDAGGLPQNLALVASSHGGIHGPWVVTGPSLFDTAFEQPVQIQCDRLELSLVFWPHTPQSLVSCDVKSGRCWMIPTVPSS